jgi:hypothetical protein
MVEGGVVRRVRAPSRRYYVFGIDRASLKKKLVVLLALYYLAPTRPLSCETLEFGGRTRSSLLVRQ